MVNQTSDNPLVAVTLRFKDGAALRQVFTTPVPQWKAMKALGQMVAEFGGELKIELEPESEEEPGARLIAQERSRQVEEEGWTAAHDKGELAIAGACYVFDYVGTVADPSAEGCVQVANDFWPWAGGTFKITPKDPIRQLVKAGALIAAEIDRLKRMEVRGHD